MNCYYDLCQSKKVGAFKIFCHSHSDNSFTKFTCVTFKDMYLLFILVNGYITSFFFETVKDRYRVCYASLEQKYNKKYI